MLVIVPDTLHIHKRGFGSLYNFLNQKEIKTLYVSEYNEYKSKYGNYKEDKDFFLEEYERLKTLTKDELFNKRLFNINIFLLAKAEIMSYVLTKKNWYRKEIKNIDTEIFDKLFKENKEELLLNMSVTIFWLKYWKKKISFQQYKKATHAIVFSGSLIYVKTFLNILENTKIKVYLVEHFFTGKDFYLENKHTHTANNTDLKYKNVFEYKKKLFKDVDLKEKEKEKERTYKRIKNAKNKNVVQPEKTEEIFFENKNKTILIMGQVINDFSIIETNNENINSLFIYKELIKKLLEETELNIILKTHPWEKKKINIGKSLTKEEITKEFKNKRLKIVEDYNLEKLIEDSDYICGLCTQSLIEATLKGKKTHQFGNAFYGEKGFTFDYKNIVDLVKNLKTEPKSNLTIKEYIDFEEWLTITFKELFNVEDELNKYYKYFNVNKKQIKSLNPNDFKEKIMSKILNKNKYKKYKLQRDKFYIDIKNPLIKRIFKYFHGIK